MSDKEGKIILALLIVVILVMSPIILVLHIKTTEATGAEVFVAYARMFKALIFSSFMMVLFSGYIVIRRVMIYLKWKWSKD